jgi:VWFA-related protein
VISESRDRGSKTKLRNLSMQLQHSSTTIYSLTYSAYLTPFTAKQDELQPGDFNPLLFITEPARLTRPNTVRALTEATGGRILGFQTLSRLEDDLISVGSEIHNRYVLSFSPLESEAGPTFHRLSVSVKGRPDLYVRARPGYWNGQGDSKP